MTFSEPVFASEDVVHVRTDQQLHAVGSLVRHRVLDVLREGPATVTQVAGRLGIAKGSSHYHVKVLAKAGLIHVVETRKVRGVVEQYYGMVAKRIALPVTAPPVPATASGPAPAQGPAAAPAEPEHLLRHALADIEAAPASEQKTVWLKHARLSPAAWAIFDARVSALMDELSALNDPGEVGADFYVVFHAPDSGVLAGEHRRDGSAPTQMPTQMPTPTGSDPLPPAIRAPWR